MTPNEWLPPQLRGALTPIERGLSGASVYRLDAEDQRYVLKLGEPSVPLADWRRAQALHRLAGEVGVGPRVVHHDEARRAVVSAYVADRGFLAFCSNPRTKAEAVTKLGELLAQVHALPLPADAQWSDPREALSTDLASLAGFTLPTFAREAMARVLAEPPSPRDRPLVVSHNDPNPSNVVFDGARLLLLDWDLAGPNDPFFDLAALALFLRMDDATVSALIAAHDGAAAAPVPPYFRSVRRLQAARCATMAFQVARRSGHPGGEARAAEAPSLNDVYARIGAGALRLRSGEGMWAFALGLVRAIDA